MRRRSALVNLVVELTGDAVPSSADARRLAASLPGVAIDEPEHCDERTLAWIDERFTGTWGAEAFAGGNVVARRNGSPIGFATFDAKSSHFEWLQGLGRERGVGIFGPFGVAAEERGNGLGRSLLLLALARLRERGYARALVPAVGDDRLIRYYAEAAGAQVAERFDRDSLLEPPARTLVMASGEGSNLQGVLDAAAGRELPVEVVAVITNNSNAGAIQRARRAGVADVHVVPWRREAETRTQYDRRLFEVAQSTRPQLVLLLGWMHLLAESFVRAFPELLNLHPAFLPLDFTHDHVVLPDGTRTSAFRGARAVRDALAASSGWVGATVHRVTPATDRGPVLARKPLRVNPGEDEARVMERLHPLERRVVREAIVRWRFERTSPD